MTQQHTLTTQETADRLSAKLQALYDGLPPDEQHLLRTIVERTRANEDDVSGFVIEGGCIPDPFPKFPTFPPPFGGMDGLGRIR